MKGNVPGLLDRLMDPRLHASNGVLPRMNVEQLKDSVEFVRLVWEAIEQSLREEDP